MLGPIRWTEPNKYGKRFIVVGLVPQKYVGTDPEQFEAVRPFAITGQLSPYMPPEFQGKRSCRSERFYVAIANGILGTALSKLNLTEAETVEPAWLSRVPTAAVAGPRLQGGAA